MKQLTCKCVRKQRSSSEIILPKVTQLSTLKPEFKTTLSSLPLRYQNVRGLNQADLLKRPSLNRLDQGENPNLAHLGTELRVEFEWQEIGHC